MSDKGEENTASLSVWKQHSRQWHRVGAPLRPSPEDGDLMMVLANPFLASSPHPRVVVMGVTPEVVQLPWPVSTQLLALDHSAEMIAQVWSPHARIQSRVGQARWQAMPVDGGSVDVVVGDGSLNVLPQLDDYGAVLAEIARVLKPDGCLVVRCFVRPDEMESLSDVSRAALDGRVGSFHALKWRVAMALGGEGSFSVAVADIHAAFNRCFPDRNVLAERAGWMRETIDTIDAYRGAATRYTFPTMQAICSVASPLFEIEETRCGHYELKERCPTLRLTRLQCGGRS